jgi:hypothetical protein
MSSNRYMQERKVSYHEESVDMLNGDVVLSDFLCKGAAESGEEGFRSRIGRKHW